jgi:putative GTP pyrophosphokinase
MELPIFYDEAEEWSNALLLYNSALKEINTKLEILNSEFKLAHQYNPIEHITSRVKSPESIAKKIRHKGKELTVENIVKYINDIAGIRIICSFTSDIYRIADLIAKQNDIKVLKVKDYIMQPKENGYASYHMIVSVPIFLSNSVIDTKVEIQIRTIAMDFWASLEHKIYYKFEGNAPESIRKELKECADIVNYLDQKMMSLNEEVHGCSRSRDDLAEYKEIMSENYRERLKECYGSVVDDDENEFANSEIIAETDINNNQIENIMEDLATNNIMQNNQKNIEKEEKKEKKGLGSFLTKVITNSE